MSMWTRKFWKAAFERAVKTAAQAGVGVAIASTPQVNVLDLDFVTLGGFMAGGALLSLLTTLASIATTGSVSVGQAEQLYDPRHGG